MVHDSFVSLVPKRSPRQSVNVSCFKRFVSSAVKVGLTMGLQWLPENIIFPDPPGDGRKQPVQTNSSSFGTGPDDQPSLYNIQVLKLPSHDMAATEPGASLTTKRLFLWEDWTKGMTDGTAQRMLVEGK